MKEADAARWTEVLWNVFLDYFKSQGIEQISYHHLPPAGAAEGDKIRIVTEGFPDDWVCQYISNKLYKIDPIADFAARADEPFFWSDIDKLTRLTKSQEAFIEARKAADIGDGLAIQVFGPFGRNGYVGIGIPEELHKQAAERAHQYQWVCQFAHQRYCAITRSSLPSLPELTPREREILQWVAKGKSNGVIADILGLSAHTIDAYMRRIFNKLGTSDRVTAAIRGIGSGLISQAY